MKNIARIGIIAVALTLAGCASTAVDPSRAGPDMQAVVEPDALPGLPIDKGQRVFVRFDESEALSRQVREMLAQRGHTLAATEADATVVVKTRSTFSFVRRASRRVSVSMGKLLDGADMKVAFSQLDNQAARTANVNLNTASMYMNGRLPTAGLAGATAVEMLLSMSGAGAAFNKALVGDERGLCVPMGGPGSCDNWKTYEQILILETDVSVAGAKTASFVARARTASEQLKPLDLFNVVMPAYFKTIGKE